MLRFSPHWSGFSIPVQCSVVGLLCLLALPRAPLEPPHAVVPLVLPFDHDGALSDRQACLFAILFLAQDQV